VHSFGPITRQTDGQTDRRTDGQKDRQTDRQASEVREYTPVKFPTILTSLGANCGEMAGPCACQSANADYPAVWLTYAEIEEGSTLICGRGQPQIITYVHSTTSVKCDVVVVLIELFYLCTSKWFTALCVFLLICTLISFVVELPNLAG